MKALRWVSLSLLIVFVIACSKTDDVKENIKTIEKKVASLVEESASALQDSQEDKITKEFPMGNPTYLMTTSLGEIVIELDAEKAPISATNFDSYVKKAYYDGTIFHRVIENFMIQGGGFDENMQQKETDAQIENEAANGLKNLRGTLAMARTSAVHSATSQFFINTVDNASLDHRSPDPGGFGYCVFGKVIEGLEVVDAIRSVKTGNSGHFQDVPQETVKIISIVAQ
jgi:cyclophilin family peptidyl-prolyl cis-trans isomerase